MFTYILIKFSKKSSPVDIIINTKNDNGKSLMNEV